jgi:hypothetical protein
MEELSRTHQNEGLGEKAVWRWKLDNILGTQAGSSDFITGSSAFVDAVVDATTKVLNHEFMEFSHGKTRFTSKLHMNASDVTPSWVKADVFGEMGDILKSDSGLPKLMKLIKEALGNAERKHPLTMGVNVLLWAKNRSFRKAQTIVGLFFMQAGVQDSVLSQFNKLGVSISPRSCGRVAESLAEGQKRILTAIGSQAVVEPFTLCYDNMQLTEGVGSQRLDNAAKRMDTTAGYVSRAILSRKGQELPTRDSLGGERLKASLNNNSHLYHTPKDDEFATEVCSYHKYSFI